MRIFKLMSVFMLVVLLSSCLQRPADQQALTGEDTCISVTDVFIVTPGSTILVNPNGPSPENEFGIVTWMVYKIESVMRISAATVYQSLSTNESWLNIINTMIALTISIMAIGILLGVVQVNAFMFAMFAVKIAFVWGFATEWDIFLEYAVIPLENLVRDLSTIMANTFSEGLTFRSFVYDDAATWTDRFSLFAYMDHNLSMFMSTGFWRMIVATFTTGWSGPIYGILLLFLVMSYVSAILTAVKVYLVSIIARSLLYSLAPFFLMFLLFKQTKSLFDGWVEQIISFSLQPIFIMAFIGMFQVLFMGFFAGIVPEYHAGQKICYSDFIQLSGWLDYLYSDRFGDGTVGAPDQSGSQAEVPLNIWIIIVCVILMAIMQSMITWSIQVATRLSGGFVTAIDSPMVGWSEMKTGAQKAAGTMGGTFSSLITAQNEQKGKPTTLRAKTAAEQAEKENQAAKDAERSKENPKKS